MKKLLLSKELLFDLYEVQKMSVKQIAARLSCCQMSISYIRKDLRWVSMALLEKQYVLYDRDDKGELVAKEVSLLIDENNERQKDLKGTTIAITPLTRGELRRVF